MNLKNIAAKILAKKAVSKILPMDDVKPALGKKSKAAAALVTVAAIATAVAEYL